MLRKPENKEDCLKLEVQMFFLKRRLILYDEYLRQTFTLEAKSGVKSAQQHYAGFALL